MSPVYGAISSVVFTVMFWNARTRGRKNSRLTDFLGCMVLGVFWPITLALYLFVCAIEAAP